MSKSFSNLLIFTSTILSIVIGTYIWKEINLPYTNPDEIVGHYLKNKHNYENDTVRYLIFIGLPLIVFLLLYSLLKKDQCNSFKNIFLYQEIKEHSKNSLLNIYLYIFIFILLMEFFTFKFPLHGIDLFHEGQMMSGGYNFYNTKKLWTSTYSNTGLFVDILNSKIAWSITGEQSIGAFRFYILFYLLITKVLFIILCYNLSKVFNLEKYTEILFFLLLVVFSMYLISFHYRTTFREIPLILLLIFSLKLLISSNRNYIYCLFIGFLSIFSLLWSLDRGVYLNLTLFPFVLLLLVRKRISQIFLILIGVALSWITFYLIIGQEEFRAFIYNSITIFKSSDLFNGIIYPTPFSNEENAARGTKNLLIIILNGIFIISSLLNKQNKIPSETKLFLAILFFLSLVCYKTGLSRSDGAHLKVALSFHLLLLIIFISFYILNLVKKYNIEEKLSYLFKNFSILIIILILFFVENNFNLKSFNNLKKFNDRYQNYVKLNDKHFLSENQIKLVERLKELSEDANCFQIFNYETAITYLLKKKSCSKFYHIWSIGLKGHQFDFIEEMKLTNPKYILVEGPYQIDISPKERFPYIYKYLTKNYRVGEKFITWKILYLK